jgi:hypothetical protein
MQMTEFVLLMLAAVNAAAMTLLSKGSKKSQLRVKRLITHVTKQQPTINANGP